MTVPITHFLYCAWSHEVWIVRRKSEIAGNSSSTKARGLDKERYHDPIPREYKIQKAKKYLIIGFALGLLTIAPLGYFAEVLMEECSESRLGAWRTGGLWKPSSSGEQLGLLSSIIGVFFG